jgi:hypothetical protein
MARHAAATGTRWERGNDMRYKVVSIVAISVALLAISLSRAIGATGTIDGADIKDFSIGSSKLATGAVGSRAIYPRSIRVANLSPGTLSFLQVGSVRSGATVRGVIGGDFPAIPAGPSTDCPNNCSWAAYASLPFPAPNILTDADVLVDNTTWVSGDTGQTQPGLSTGESGSPAACTGSVANPTAPAGKVCIYIAGGDNAEDVAGYSVVPGTGGSKYGFKLHWVSSGPGTANNTFIDAVWAYHAA